MLTFGQALTAGEFHHVTQSQGGGACYRVRRNGKTQTWVRTPGAFSIPVRWGMRARDQFRITHSDAGDWNVAATCPRCVPVKVECPMGHSFEATRVEDFGNGITRVKVTDTQTSLWSRGALIDVATDRLVTA